MSLQKSFEWVLMSTMLLLIQTDVKAERAIGSFSSSSCTLCQGLKYCTSMNGKLFFDPVYKYTREATSQLEKQGACDDLDAKTFELSQFGTEFQFKNTSQCRRLVYNFHCLSWVQTTFSSTMNGDKVSCDDSMDKGPMPLPPCRSLCVEVADKCVFSHFYRMYLENVCENIPCITEEEELLSQDKKQLPCVQGEWEKIPNSTFSRCSIRAYLPTASARKTLYSIMLLVLVFILTISTMGSY